MDQMELDWIAAAQAGNRADERLATGEHSPELRRASRRGKDAKAELVKRHERLVVKIARATYDSSDRMEFEDAKQEGMCGLMRAIDKFDPTRQTKFSSFAYFWIRAEISRSVMRQGAIIPIGAPQYRLLPKLWKAQDAIYQETQCRATPHELAERLDVEVSEVEAALAASYMKPDSLDYESAQHDNPQDLLEQAQSLYAQPEPTVTVHIDTVSFTEDEKRSLIDESFSVRTRHTARCKAMHPISLYRALSVTLCEQI